MNSVKRKKIWKKTKKFLIPLPWHILKKPIFNWYILTVLTIPYAYPNKNTLVIYSFKKEIQDMEFLKDWIVHTFLKKSQNSDFLCMSCTIFSLLQIDCTLNTQFVNCKAYLLGEWNRKERKDISVYCETFPFFQIQPMPQLKLGWVGYFLS